MTSILLTPSNAHFIRLRRFLHLLPSDIFVELSQSLKNAKTLLKSLFFCGMVYQHIYSHYEEMEALNEMTDESLILDIDIIDMAHEEEMKKLEKKLTEKLTEKDNVIAEQERELALLRKQLSELQK